MQAAGIVGPTSNRSKGQGQFTEAKQSLLSMDDLTLSATDGTALRQPSKGGALPPVASH